jgi:transcriptional regulator with XRE-family HTH domain
MTPERYKEIRKRLGLSQGKLAAIVGVTVPTISKRESGKKRILPEAAMAMEYLLVRAIYHIPENI